MVSLRMPDRYRHRPATRSAPRPTEDNHLAAACPVLAETAGYYYVLARFIAHPLVLATTGANVVFWTWPAAPPRFAVPGMTDILLRYGILGAGSPHGPDSLVNLYAAMPSLHVAWAAWCAAALVAATRGWRRTWPGSTPRPPRSWCSPRPTTSSPTPPPAWPSPPWACLPP